ncbi:MAG: thymidylate kinase [Candidatus Gottesmanbacteria bacterium GW2011_GWB1_43_11]|uniref:Thymidylate kinase n=1 Tax=Candidatus Gottesmanbacteria bacterium GW2011_GWB1_43_11 TaxID=1618446 RepID=A0A0G1EU04_9BACT|nr:MAG: thymidylate kinase [Candidatus Gottesmanbacteria bacterium GW2011_GWA2_42_16]KKS80735.1 MAG: thymidylate kinase [Candidatus Gottesmanbacteria bacterium GW2011_GWC1_43_10]KKS86566.1 MAG: thymidylate kinase [Candidatus Gottesmanbacteria bacterium GW2011_GWB1_43_11]OGG10697.1 MAG: dTMP kinase [Candidatus Gottesmanbacteria bacterium RIFCSPHIGHO2_01_FULL_43_15]OGG25250.1 MAG: dTMP kinase [Candidatus Gottesmanbacteria bacterium RIFCSPLOWO2_01_FULL_42_10]HCM37761.1 dTMP kinase [Patescibacteri
MKRGYFITFEGGEGAGKSIQVEILASHLHEEGYHVKVTREPGGTRIGEQIRAITHSSENVDLEATTEAYLMAAARAQHVEQVIFPSLEAGHIVVCDRYVDSSIAYQGYGRKLGPEKIAELNELAVNGAIPDLTLLLNVPIEKGLRRRNKSLKPRDRLDLQQKEFYERVYVGYLELAQKNPQRYVVIDATKPIEQVGSEIWEVVRQKLQKHHGK